MSVRSIGIPRVEPLTGLASGSDYRGQPVAMTLARHVLAEVKTLLLEECFR